MFFDAVENWGYISSKMKGFWVITSKNSTCDTFYVSETDVPGLLGECYSFKTGWFGYTYEAGVDSDWTFCKIFVYKNTFDDSNITTSQRIATISHELGHSQKLAHPSTMQTSIMNQGVNKPDLPTTYDKNEIKRKWGN